MGHTSRTQPRSCQDEGRPCLETGEHERATSLEQRLVDLHPHQQPHGGNIHKRKVPLSSMLAIGFAPCRRSSDLAAQYSIDRVWVRHVRACVAALCLQTQSLVLGCLMARATAERPSFVGIRLGWDETGEKVQVDLGVAFATPDKLTVGTWNVMVTRLRLIICWGEESYDFAFVLPPLLVASTSAANLYYGIHRHAFYQPVWRAVLYLFQRAEWSLLLSETDAASSNVRLGAHQLTMCGDRTHFAHWFCSLHQAHHVDASIAAVASRAWSLISRLLYSFTLMLRNTNMFTRMRLFSGVVLRAKLNVFVGIAPPPGASVFANELAEYLLIHYERRAAECSRARMEQTAPPSCAADADDHADDDQRSLLDPKRAIKHRGLRSFRDRLLRLVAVLNGCWWMQDCVSHYCHGASCVGPCHDHASALTLATSAVQSIIFDAQPQTPSLSKWSKLGPCLDVMLLGILCHNFFGRAMEQLQVRDTSATMTDGQEESQFASDMDWGGVQGKRYSLAMCMFRDGFSRSCLVALALATEPMRFVVAWLMSLAREARDPCRGPPSMDLFNDRYSLIVHVLQYIASVVRGASSRFVLLWRTSQCESYEDWCASRPNEVRMFRRMLLVATCAVYRRFVVRSRQAPWCLVSLADSRIDEHGRRRIAQQFLRSPPCCVCPGMARQILESPEKPSVDDLVGPVWSHRFSMLAALLTLQCADIEWRHSRNRKRSGAGVSVAQLAARAVCSEALVNQTASRCRQQTLYHRSAPAPPAEV